MNEIAQQTEGQQQYRLIHLKKVFLDALLESKGIVTKACLASGIPRPTFYGWMGRDPHFKALVNDIREVVIDFAEDALFKNIEAGDVTSTIFLLKTLGKQRGYIERVEIDQEITYKKQIFKIGDVEIEF